MNCSQKLISLIFEITKRNYRTAEACCELLSKLISLIFGTTCHLFLWHLTRLWIFSKVDIFDILNNIFKILILNFVLRIVSKVDIFDIEQRRKSNRNDNQLWIALKSWYLWYSNNKRNYGIAGKLLWIYLKVDIFDIRNNNKQIIKLSTLVVNALKVDIFDIRNNYRLNLCTAFSCELLSKVDIFDIRNNVSG